MGIGIPILFRIRPVVPCQSDRVVLAPGADALSARALSPARQRDRAWRMAILAIALYLPQVIVCAQANEAAEAAKAIATAPPQPAEVKKLTAGVTRPLVDPVWKVALSGTQLDILQLLPADRILVGTLREGWDRFAEVTTRGFLDLSMRQASTGALIWQFDRSRLGADTFDLIAVDPVILCSAMTSSGSTHVYAIDANKGTQLWRFSNPTLVMSVPGAAMVLAVKPGMFSGASVMALRATDGKELWSVDIPREAKRRPPRIEIHEGAAYVIQPDIIKIDLADGKVIWRAKLPVKLHPLLQVGHSDRALILSDAEKVEALDAGGGTPVWTFSQPKEMTVNLAVAEGAIFQFAKTAAWGSYALRAIDAAAGAELWRSNERHPLQSALEIEPERLTYATTNELVSVHRGTGETLLRTPLPSRLPPDRFSGAEAPFLLRLGAGSVTVASQKAVARFDLAAGAWSVQDSVALPASLVHPAVGGGRMEESGTAVPGYKNFLPANVAYANDMLHQAQRGSDLARREAERATTLMRPVVGPEQREQLGAAVPGSFGVLPANAPNADGMVQQAQRSVDAARREVERAKAPDTRSTDREIDTLNRQHASIGLQLAIQGQIAATRLAQSGERNAALQDLVSSVTGLMDSISTALKRMQAIQKIWRDTDAAHAYVSMLQSDYYVRQRAGTNSLHVVDLRRGANATLDLLTDTERNRHPHTIHAVDAENRRIFALAMRPDESAPLVDRLGKKVPARYLAAFDIDALAFRPLVQRSAGTPAGSAGQTTGDGNPPAPQK